MNKQTPPVSINSEKDVYKQKIEIQICTGLNTGCSDEKCPTHGELIKTLRNKPKMKQQIISLLEGKKKLKNLN